jgi:ferritin-like metal-binding protein YciE
MSLQEVFVKELRDLYSAENQLVKALPKVAKAADSEELREAVTHHLEQTKEQVARLKQIFEQLEERPTGELCKGMEGLVAEGKEAIESEEEGAVKDIELIGACLRVEHYEIAGYTTAIRIAKALGEEEAAELLNQTLEEETATGKLLLTQAKPLLAKAGEEVTGEEEEEDSSDAA